MALPRLARVPVRRPSVPTATPHDPRLQLGRDSHPAHRTPAGRDGTLEPLRLRSPRIALPLAAPCALPARLRPRHAREPEASQGAGATRAGPRAALRVRGEPAAPAVVPVDG